MTENNPDITVKTIVTEWLKANGYDGLRLPGMCGCRIEELFDYCNSDGAMCQPGYMHESFCGQCDKKECPITGYDADFAICGSR